MLSPTHGTPFPFQPLHPWPVGCWLPCMRSVHCRVVFLRQFGWYPVVSAALWLACASWGSLRCSPRWCSRMLSLLSFRFVVRFAVAGLSGVVNLLRPGRARCVVLVRWCRGRQWSARPRLFGGPLGPSRPCLVPVAVPYAMCSPSDMFFFVVCPVLGRPRVRLLCFCQYFGWYAVVFAVQWSACPAVGCVGPCWPCKVGSGCSSCFGPIWYVLTVRRPLMVGRVLSRGKVATIGTTAEKSFESRYDMPCRALEASLQSQPIIWYFAVPFGCPFSFACADHMYTPVSGKAPSVPPGASPCSPREPQGAALARWCGARACVCRPAVCRIVPCLAGPVVCVLVPQCRFRRLGWPGSCSGLGASCPARRAGLGATLPCSPAGPGGLVGPAR